MERVHYRRVTDRSQPPRTQAEPGGSAERIIVQAIVAALIMVAVMCVCLLDYDFTVAARDGLRKALSGQTTPDGLFTEISKLSGELFSGEMFSSAPFGVPETIMEPIEPALVPAQITSFEQAAPAAQSVPAAVTLTADVDESKITVPELSAFPEP